LDSIAQRARQCIASEHGLALSSLCLLECRSIPKTTSGKIARSWCRRAFLDNALKVVKRVDSVTGIGQTVEAIETDHDIDGADIPGNPGPVPMGPREPALSPEETRALSVAEIQNRLEVMLIRISSQSGAGLTPPVDPDAAINSLGLDSLSVVQFNGVLQKKFHCVLPDDYVFSQHASLSELSKSVKQGGLTPEQTQFLETSGEEGGGKHTAPIAPKSPLCPWFVCCY
jgi:acyl carrier protein